MKIYDFSWVDKNEPYMLASHAVDATTMEEAFREFYKNVQCDNVIIISVETYDKENM
jgi:hypothetical protein